MAPHAKKRGKPGVENETGTSLAAEWPRRSAPSMAAGSFADDTGAAGAVKLFRLGLAVPAEEE